MLSTAGETSEGVTLSADAPLPVHRKDTLPVERTTWREALRLYREGEHGSAAVLFGLIARVGPHRQQALVARASALMHLGRLAEAADLLKRALQRNPLDPVAAMNLATCYYCLGANGEALAQAEAAVDLFRAAELNPAHPYHLQGLIHLEAGRTGRAREAFTWALKAAPGFTPAVVGLARCALAEGDHRRADHLLRRARALLSGLSRGLRESTAGEIDRLEALLPHPWLRRLRCWLDRLPRPNRHPEPPGKECER